MGYNHIRHMNNTIVWSELGKKVLEVLTSAMQISISRTGSQKDSTGKTYLYWFRYIVSYVQLGVDLFYLVCSSLQEVADDYGSIGSDRFTNIFPSWL